MLVKRLFRHVFRKSTGRFHLSRILLIILLKTQTHIQPTINNFKHRTDVARLIAVILHRDAGGHQYWMDKHSDKPSN